MKSFLNIWTPQCRKESELVKMKIKVNYMNINKITNVYIDTKVKRQGIRAFVLY